ncbi:hypothetical protein G6021_01310 [Dietzia sp. CW19]|uniref:HipA domain-containing protein n=1 Tax=Dietzia sp. CW19 TaxID=1630634 RepID=UPI0015FE4AEF|nr:hypothetical protein [Dietzia sp. CW19]
MVEEIRDISHWVVVGQEAVGADPKFWVAESAASERPDWWLFKAPKTGLKSGRPYRRGDDWAEAVCAGLAPLVGLPSATVDLARYGDTVGVMSRNVAPPGWDLISGDTLLSEFPDYESCAGGRKPPGRPGHHPQNIAAVLDGVESPLRSPDECPTAMSAFVGYLVFDVWVANTDRHAENWAVLDNGRSRRLAESFDHGSALSSGLEDHEIDRFRNRVDLERFASKARAQRFAREAGRTLTDVVVDAAQLEPTAARFWRDRVCEVDTEKMTKAVADVPGMSDARRTFVMRLLEENLRRLRDVHFDS